MLNTRLFGIIVFYDLWKGIVGQCYTPDHIIDSVCENNKDILKILKVKFKNVTKLLVYYFTYIKPFLSKYKLQFSVKKIIKYFIIYNIIHTRIV